MVVNSKDIFYGITVGASLGFKDLRWPVRHVPGVSPTMANT